MAEYTQLGPETYLVNVAVTRGQLVMPDGTTGRIKPATAAATTVLGVARDDASPPSALSPSNFATLRDEVAVFQAPYTVKVTVSGATDVAFGQKVIAGAAGSVVPISGTAAAADGTTVVGYCVDPAGIVAGQSGKIKLV
jgi:hypothetical protein